MQTSKEKKYFDYTPFETDLVTTRTVKKMLDVALDPDGGFKNKVMNFISLIVAGICIFILWRLRDNALQKHKQQYEIGETNGNQDQIDDDDLD